MLDEPTMKRFENVESKLNITKCADVDKVEYAACLLQGRALTWRNTQVQIRGRDAANGLTWDNFKSLLIEEYCRKDELAKMVPHMVSTEEKRIDQYIWGLFSEIRMIVTSSNPTTLQVVVGLAYHLTNDMVRTSGAPKGQDGSSNSDTDKIMARMDAMTMKMDAQYKDFQSRSKQSNLDDDDIPMSREEEAKFMQTFHRTRFYNDYRDRDSNRDNWRSSGINDYHRDNYQSHSDDKPDLQKKLSDFIKAQHSTNSFVKDTFMDLKNKLETTTKNHQASIQNLKAKFHRLADKKSGQHSGSLPSNTQPNLKGSLSKPYQPPQAQNEHVNVVFTWSGKSYDPPDNPNDQQNNSKTPINFDSNDEDDEPTPQPKPKTTKPVKETPIPKPYKLKIPYPQRLRKEKMEAQYGKFLDMI
ncbi:hypothetical protein Tco_0261097 [Tanacetum coccineum]